MGGSAADAAMFAETNSRMDVILNTGTGSIVRGLGGGAEQSAPMPGNSSAATCGCN
jgi:hypothetical protein